MAVPTMEAAMISGTESFFTGLVTAAVALAVIFSLLMLQINPSAACALCIQCFATVLSSLNELSTATGMREKNWYSLWPQR